MPREGFFLKNVWLSLSTCYCGLTSLLSVRDCFPSFHNGGKKMWIVTWPSRRENDWETKYLSGKYMSLISRFISDTSGTRLTYLILKPIKWLYFTCSDSFSFVVPLVVICCRHSLLFVIIHCHSLSFVVTHCNSLSFVITRCHSLSLVVPYISLSVVVTRCTTRLSFYKRSSSSRNNVVISKVM